MANSLISYPRFKDLEKSNITFVETVPNPSKSRRHRSRNKEQLIENHIKSVPKENYNTEYNVTSDNENCRNNTLSIKKKELHILPTLDEKEEKVHYLNSMQKVKNKILKTIIIQCYIN